MSKFLKKIFPFLFKTAFYVKPKHEIELAFVHEGIEYFRFVNDLNIPVERAFAAQDVYEEMNHKLDATYLDSLLESVLKAANKGELVKIVQLISIAKEKRKHITNVDMIYKLASVLYFDKTENCYTYDYEYAEIKMNRWRKGGVQDFFLKTPLKDFLPSFDSLELSIETYTRAQRKDLIQALEFQSLILSEGGENKDMISKCKSLISTLKNLTDSDKMESVNI
jgi:hypothetical protein